MFGSTSLTLVRSLSRAIVGIVAVAGVLIAVGCGGSDSNDSGESKPAATAKAADACGKLPRKLPEDPDGVLAGLPEELLAGYDNHPNAVHKSDYVDFKPLHEKPWKVAWADQALNNSWNEEQRRARKAAIERAKEQGLVSSYVEANANYDVTTQIQQMRHFIQDKVDLIIAEPVSDTGLNRVIDDARKAGIAVVTLDAPVTTTSAVNVHGNLVLYGARGAQAMIEAMGTKGDVLRISGIPGFAASELMDQGADAVLEHCPDIDVVEELVGEWDPAVAKAALLNFLATHPQVEIDGIWQSSSTPALIDAFESVGRPVPPISDGGPLRGSLAYWAQNKDSYKGGGVSLPPAGGADAAVRIGLKILEGQGPKVSDIIADTPIILAKDLDRWADPAWDLSDLGIADPTTGEYLNEAMIAPLFEAPADVLQ
jgi:ribose transport system substrate-binding protein